MKYHEEITKAVQAYQNRIRLVKKLNDDIKVVKSLYPKLNLWLDHEINISWAAKSMDEVKEMLRTFAKNGIMLAENGYRASETSPVWNLKGKNCNIRLNPYWNTGNEEGQTCRLVQVGEETKTYPKYKLVCDGKDEIV